MKPKLSIYTDGGCSRKFGVGAFAVWCPEINYKFVQLVDNPTNNQMELAAFITALRLGLAYSERDVTIVTDSMYCKGGYDEWMHAWDITSRNNADLWQIIYDLKINEGARFAIRHCRGHGKGSDDLPEDVAGNDVVDRLCTKAIEDYKKLKI